MITILLVEDDRAQATYWREALEAENYRVVHETTVEGAIASLDELTFDVVITDIVLETNDAQLTESGGFAIISYIALNVEPQPRILATSGLKSSSTFVDRNFKKMNSLRALHKPVSNEQLVATINELLSVEVRDNERPSAEHQERVQQLTYSLEAMLELLGATDGVWDWRVGTDEVTYAPGFRKLLGFNGNDTAGFPDRLEVLSDRIHPEDRQEVWACINASLLEKTPLIHEFRLRHKRGDYIWVRSRSTANFDDRGQALRMVGSMHDITESVVAQRRLEESDARFRNIANTLPSLIWLMNPDGSIEWVNDFVFHFSGVEQTEMYENGWAQLFHPDDLAKAQTDVEASLLSQSGYNTEIRLRRADGEYRWFYGESVPRFDAAGQFLGLVGSATDLHESREGYLGELKSLNEELTLANEQLLLAEQKLHTVINTASSGIIGLGSDRTVVFVNDAARHMLGGIGEETPFIWPDNVHFLDNDDLTQLESSKDPINRASVGQKIHNEVLLMNRLTGDGPRYVRVSTSPVPESNQSGLHVVLVLDDVSEQEKNRQQVERSSRLDALGQLTGGIAHDFNNLLATIDYSLQLTSMKLRDVETVAVHDYLDRALASIKRGSALTNRLLAFAKRQPGLARSARTNVFLEEFRQLVEPAIEESIEIAFACEHPDLWLYCDPAQLENSLLNVVLNSRDAIIRGGKGAKIMVIARGVSELDADAVLRKENPHTYIAKGLHEEHARERSRDDHLVYRYVEIAVTDDGPGMSDEVKQRAIDPFFTTKATNSGTGLGLSMVYGFIQQSDGELRIYSEVGHGTTVRLIIPRGTETGEREMPVERLPAPSGSGQRILIVEDEAPLLAVMADLVAALGYEPVKCNAANDALSRIKAGETIDLLLTDVVMPGGTGGFELAKQVRALLPNLPVLYMSGYTGFSETEMGDVVAPLLQKPCPPAELVQVLQKMLSAATG